MRNSGNRSITGHMAITLAAMTSFWLGCGDGKANPDQDTTVECDAPFDSWETGGEGADISTPPPAGQARAGRIASADDVPGGVKNNAGVGDYMLRNSRVMFVIEDIGESDGYQPFGGGIVHADLVGADGEPLGLNMFGESFHGLSIRLLDPDSITVISDGADGGEAVVRVIGPMRNMPLLDVAFNFFFEVNDGVEYIADWVLGPDSEFLELRFHIRNPLLQWAYVNLIIFGAIQGDGLEIFTPESGFDLDSLSGRHDLFGHVGQDISYGWLDAQGGTLQYVMEESQILVGEKGVTLPMEGCTERTVPVIRLLVAKGGAESLLAAARRVAGAVEPAPTTFNVSVTGGADASGATVHVLDGSDGYVTSAIADPSGSWHAGLTAGDYTAIAVLDGHQVTNGVAFDVDASGANVDLVMEQPGTLEYTVEDQDANPIPAKIMIFPDAASDLLPPSFGVKTLPLGAAAFDYEADGSGTVVLPAGGYHLSAARGFEYEIEERSFTITAGTTETLSIVLDHSVDSTGMLCGDFHVHSVYSPDSSDPRAAKVRAAAAEGVEILVSTDHEWVADYQVEIEAEGLQAWVHGVPGEELTTYDYGHMNVYPMTVRPDEPNEGAIDWYYRQASDVFAEVHTDPLDPVLQINHPRSGGSLGGYFTAIGLDPETGTVGNPDVWSPAFQAVEVFNGEDFRSQEDLTVKDWFALLSMGMKVTAMANSDTHNLIWSEIGYPRSCLFVGHDDPSTLTNIDLRDTVKAMKVTVTGGILVTAQGPAGEGYGDVVDAPSGTADIHVIVQAPSWMSADRLRVFVNGVEVSTITLDETTVDPANPAIRFDDVLVVTTDGGGDGFVVFAAEGDSDMTPVVEGHRPFGMTNPIYLDADSDGAFDPFMSMP